MKIEDYKDQIYTYLLQFWFAEFKGQGLEFPMDLSNNLANNKGIKLYNLKWSAHRAATLLYHAVKKESLLELKKKIGTNVDIK